jgi:hypothetical protein
VLLADESHTGENALQALVLISPAQLGASWPNEGCPKPIDVNCGVSVEGCRQIGPALWLLQKVECAHLSFVAGRLSGAPIVQRRLRPSLEKRLHAFRLHRLGLAR